MTAVDVRPAARLATGSRPPTAFSEAVLTALGTVADPDTDEPITGLGLVRSVAIENREVTVHLRLPDGSCSPDAVYLTVSDTYDALSSVPGTAGVRIVLADHDFGPADVEIVSSRNDVESRPAVAPGGAAELWAIVRRRAHDAAVERCCRMMLRRGTWTTEELPQLELLDLPEGSTKSALVRRRHSLGLPAEPHSRVLVDDAGRPVTQLDLGLQLRLTRPSCTGSAGGPSCHRHLFARRT